MKMHIGIDIIQVSQFDESYRQEGEHVLSKIFLEQELKNDNSPLHLAGLFAAKEAVIKALSLPIGSWQQIAIRKEKSGNPFVELLGETLPLLTSDLSISHNGEYAVAVYVAVLKG